MSKDNKQDLAGDYSGVSAETYQKRRFESSVRMQKLHARENAFAEELLQRVGPDAVIVDVPCGSGRFTKLFSNSKYLFSIDISADMLEQAKKEAAPSFNGEFILASATDIPLADVSVDLAFCMRLLHHVGDSGVRKKILQELCRISRRWVMTTFYRKESYRYYRKRLLGKKVSGQPITINQFEQEALECGLRVVQMNPKKPLAYMDASTQTMVLLEKIS